MDIGQSDRTWSEENATLIRLHTSICRECLKQNCLGDSGTQSELKTTQLWGFEEIHRTCAMELGAQTET